MGSDPGKTLILQPDTCKSGASVYFGLMLSMSGMKTLFRKTFYTDWSKKHEK